MQAAQEPFIVAFYGRGLCPLVDFYRLMMFFCFVSDENSKENEPNHFAKAFNKENLSDSGISDGMLQHFCSADPTAVRQLDSVKYNTEDDTYTW